MPIESSPLQENSQVYRDLLKSQTRLATGKRIQNGSDDPAGLIAAKRFRAYLEQQEAAKDNLNYSRDLVQTTDAALGEITSLIHEGKGLALQASNSFIDDDVRQALSSQLSEIKSSINRIASNTEFGNNSTLSGSLSNQTDGLAAVYDSEGSIELNTLDDLSTAGLELHDVSFDNFEDAAASLEIFDDALALVSENRGRLGSLQNQLESQVRIIDEKILSNTESLSRLDDTDYLRETAELRQNEALYEAYVKTIKEEQKSSRYIGRVLDLNR